MSTTHIAIIISDDMKDESNIVEIIDEMLSDVISDFDESDLSLLISVDDDNAELLYDVMCNHDLSVIGVAPLDGEFEFVPDSVINVTSIQDIDDTLVEYSDVIITIGNDERIEEIISVATLQDKTIYNY